MSTYDENDFIYIINENKIILKGICQHFRTKKPRPWYYIMLYTNLQVYYITYFISKKIKKFLTKFTKSI